jgi:hypothetical protein
MMGQQGNRDQKKPEHQCNAQNSVTIHGTSGIEMKLTRLAQGMAKMVEAERLSGASAGSNN